MSTTVPGSLIYRTETGASDGAELGLRLRPGISRSAWETMLRRYGHLEKMVPWALGDLVFYGEGEYGVRYDEMAELSGVDAETLSLYASVAGRFPLERRRPKLTVQHYAQLMLWGSDDEQERILAQAEEEGWSSRELKRALKEATLSEAGGMVSGETPERDAPILDETPPASESAILASTLEGMRLGVKLHHAELLSPRLEAEGISAERWVERCLDEALGIRDGSVPEDAIQAGIAAVPEN